VPAIDGNGQLSPAPPSRKLLVSCLTWCRKLCHAIAWNNRPPKSHEWLDLPVNGRGVCWDRVTDVTVRARDRVGGGGRHMQRQEEVSAAAAAAAGKQETNFNSSQSPRLIT